MDDLQRLRDIAQAAHYEDNPWREVLGEYAGVQMYSECDVHDGCGPIVEDVNVESGELRQFVITFNPPTVLALLDVIEAAELWCGGEERLLPRRVHRALTRLEQAIGEVSP